MFWFPSGRVSTVFVAQLLYPWALLLLATERTGSATPL